MRSSAERPLGGSQAGGSAEDERRLPILLYQQNRKPWRCVMGGCICGRAKTSAVVEVTAEAFLAWLEADLLARLTAG